MHLAPEELAQLIAKMPPKQRRSNEARLNRYYEETSGSAKPEKQSKYKNRIVRRDGMTFRSQKESDNHAELELEERAGLITDLLHEKVILPIFDADGRKLFSYKPDHTYFRDGVLCVCDSKGMRTARYVMAKRAVENFYGIKIIEL